ncbi:MAG: cupin domain-containing protein [Actinomycetota bacterium]
MTGFRVIRPLDRIPDAASGTMRREAAISQGSVGARKLWFGYVELGPGLVSAVHHHGESESAIFLISGLARFCAGEGLEEVHDAGPGDFVWVPPHLIHVEMNRSATEPVRMVVARSTQEAIVVNLPAPAGWTPPVGLP